jgi:hypothetical protein
MSHVEHSDVSKQKIQYTTRLVAFLDILGFKDLIREAAEPTRAIDIIFHLEKSLLHARGSSQEVSVRMFSDCISMSSPPTPSGLEALFWRCIVVQGLLLRYGYLLRGAIMEGHHYESDRIIFSEGLVRSYQSEAAAIYPRVIVAKQIAERAPTTVQHQDAPWSPASTLLLQDRDGMFFLDYFRFMEILAFIDAWKPEPWESADLSHAEPPEGFVMPDEFLEIHHALVKKGQDTHADDPRVFQKYAWMGTYQDRPDRFQAPLRVRTRSF